MWAKAKRTYREIRAVGLEDWLWFVLYLKRNEHHPSLNLYRFDGKKGALDKMERRKRAHEIDLTLRDV